MKRVTEDPRIEYEPPTYVEIGNLFGISGQRVKQLERAALRKMARHPILQELAKDYGIVESKS